MALPATLPVTAPVSSTQATEAANNDNSVNYLNRCVEEITEQAQSKLSFMKGLNMTVAIGTGVLYIAATIASIVLTAIFAPPSIPFAALGAFCLGPFVHSFITQRLDIAANYQSGAQRCKDIRELLEKLPASSAEITQRLREIGINVADISNAQVRANPALLRPVLAHYLYWHDKSQELQTEADKTREEQRTHAQQYPDETEEVFKLRLKAISKHENALISKTNAAFYLGILKNPSFSKKQTDVVTYHDTVDGDDPKADLQVLGQRALAANFGDPKEDVLLNITQASGAKETLSRLQVRDMSEAEITRRLFA